MSKQFLTTDDLLCYYHYGDFKKISNLKKECKRLIIFFALLISLIFVLIICPSNIFKPLKVTIAIVYVISNILFVYELIKVELRQRKNLIFLDVIAKKIDPIEESATWEKFKKAGGFDNYIENALWAIECEEAHIPGDCPLCGAI